MPIAIAASELAFISGVDVEPEDKTLCTPAPKAVTPKRYMVRADNEGMVRCETNYVNFKSLIGWPTRKREGGEVLPGLLTAGFGRRGLSIRGACAP